MPAGHETGLLLPTCNIEDNGVNVCVMHDLHTDQQVIGIVNFAGTSSGLPSTTYVALM